MVRTNRTIGSLSQRSTLKVSKKQKEVVMKNTVLSSCLEWELDALQEVKHFGYLHPKNVYPFSRMLLKAYDNKAYLQGNYQASLLDLFL